MALLMALLVIYSSCAGLARGNYEPKCSDNWYDFCNSMPTPAAASHETTIESCYLSCALENILGYCDWFIYEPKAYQSCKMYTTPMDAFLAGCTARQGGPTCLTDDVPPNDCDANCPRSQGDCAACGHGTVEHDKCNGIVGLTCPMKNNPRVSVDDAPGFDQCKKSCLELSTKFGDTINLTNAVFDSTSDTVDTCECYDSAEMDCESYVVAASVDMDSLNECIPTGEMDSTTVPTPTETTTTNLIESRHRIRFQPEEETYAGIEEGTDHIHAIVDNGLGDFVDRTSFIFREGLCGTPGYVSLESTLYPGKFWRHQGMDVKLHDRADDDLFKKDSCFLIVNDKCGAGSVSFYAVNYPDRLITKCGNQLRIEPETGDTCGSSDNFCWLLVNF